MARIKEALDGGLYDGPDPAQLGPGQLSYIQNAVYRPSSPALRRAPGRVTWGTATSDAVALKIDDLTGLRDAQFDNSAGHYLIAQVSGAVPAYVTAFVGDTGTFGILTAGITAGSALESIQFENSFYLLNGSVPSSATQGPNTNKVFYLSASAASSQVQIRQHGMFEVSATGPTATASSPLAVSGEGFLEYWTTEVIKYSKDGGAQRTPPLFQELESSFGGTPLTYYISASIAENATIAPIVQRPEPINPTATHWRIYRSPFKVYSTDRVFPAGFLAGERPITATSFTDTSTSTVGSFATAGGVWLSSGWTTPTEITAGGHVYATVDPTKPGILIASAFNFGGFQGPIIGIEARITAYATAGSNAGATVTIAKKGNVNGNLISQDFFGAPMGQRSFNVTSTNSSSPDVVTIGGPTDRWVPHDQIGFVDTDFTSDLIVALKGSYNLAVDAIGVRVYYGAGASNDAIIPFPTVVYTFGFETSQVGRNGTPPCSRTGDIFEDALVVNDESNPSLMRYSYPGKPDYFPGTYFIDFETKDNDRVQCIKIVNNRLIVMMDHAVYRVNYLPSERDASFDRGKAIEPISQTYGCINPMCACTFSLDDSNQILAFVSQKGIHTTDGFSFNTLTDNINWRNILSLTSTSRGIALVNDPEAKVLKFLYRNDANTETHKILELSYADRHATKEELKIAGQVNMRNWNATIGSAANPGSLWTIPRSNGDTMTVIGYGSATGAGGGMVYRENGTTIPALDPNMAFATRRMFLGGEGGEVRLNEVYGYIGSYTNSIGVAVSAKVIKTNDDSGEQTKAAKDQLYGGRVLGKWQMNQIAEGVRLSAVVSGNPNNDVAWDYLLLDGIGFGEEDSGK